MSISIEVIPLGPVAVGARAWRHRGRRLLTAIVKASFTINQDGEMSVTQPAPVVTEERHYRNNPVASLVRASDLALLVPKPEVVVVGHAYSAPGQKMPSTTVRLAVARGTTMLINKRLEIVGDRRARPGEPPPEPTPFEKMPVLYERALGGIASRDNPVGTGLATDPDGLLTLPNVNPPAQGGVTPTGLGPIPSAWPIRQKKRGSLSWAAANTLLDVDVPDDFDDAYFQTAPADQQVSELLGGDLIAIVNMHPELGTVRCTLPTARGVALAQTRSGDRIPLALRIDTVHIQPDVMRAEIVYRGAAVVSEDQLFQMRLAGALEEPDAPHSFPDLATIGGLVPQAGPRMPSQIDLGSTAVIAEEPPPAQRAPQLYAQPRPQAAPVPAAHPARGHAGTMIIEPDAPPKAAEPRPVDTAPQKNPNQSTLVIEPEFEPKSLPFQKKPVGRGGTAEMQATENKTATPWAGPSPVHVRPAATALTSTLGMDDTEDGSGYTLEDPLTDDPPTGVIEHPRGEPSVAPQTASAPPPPPAPSPQPAPSRPPATPSAPPAPPARVPAPTPPPPPDRDSEPPPPPPRPPAAPPKPSVTSALYKRFKK